MPGQTEPSPHLYSCEHQPSLVEVGKRAWVNANCKVLHKVQSLGVVEGTSVPTVQLVLLQPSCPSLTCEGTALRLLSGELEAPFLIATGGSIPLFCLAGVPTCPGASQDEAGLTRIFET